MPPTRTGSRSHTPSNPKPRRPPPKDKETIVISSDTEDNTDSSSKENARSTRRKSKPPSTLRPFRSILELSDDEFFGIPANSDEPNATHDETAALKKEIEELQMTRSVLEAENKELRGQVVAKPKLDPSKLEDHLCCEICTGKLWSPYILPDCGHTFCESCLTDWFSTTLTKHMTNHPQYHPNEAPAVPRYLREMLHMINVTPEQYRRVLAAFPKPVPDPEYTCPSCRATVNHPPVESFVIKSLVRAVAEAEGEKSPRKHGSHNRGKSRRTGPWDGFFRP